ncbi:uncharacterized protein LOC131251215 isoform X2 [Magnolia sinica]|uniref:uncharacterized protein LOC131251215 isoform X2 n=1 Tax=Magnolia sinica TaxID=86752 RepID=UPI00265A9E97|nr:uncharacterized protein LOC131251215 isoform X2 [Magnolia sinica]
MHRLLQVGEMQSLWEAHNNIQFSYGAYKCCWLQFLCLCLNDLCEYDQRSVFSRSILKDGDSVCLCLLAWHGVGLDKIKTMLWIMALLAIWWAVWEERNARCFGNSKKSVEGTSARARMLMIERASVVSQLNGCNLKFLG